MDVSLIVKMITFEFLRSDIAATVCAPIFEYIIDLQQISELFDVFVALSVWKGACSRDDNARRQFVDLAVK